VNEFPVQTHELAGAARGALDAFEGVFLAAVKRAQREGGISAQKKPDILAKYLVGCMSGLHTLLKSGYDKGEALAVVTYMLEAL
jgi:hypothetical protein